jgi:hypothetical protein
LSRYLERDLPAYNLGIVDIAIAKKAVALTSIDSASTIFLRRWPPQRQCSVS